MVDSGFNSPAYSSSLRHSETRSPESGGQTAEATVISARFSSRDRLTVHLVADRLLSDCWTKACEFARNFNALHIDIDHLLLGASHVRDAESALSAVCDDVEALTHELARICARRSFADVPDDNEAYGASQALQIILCEASALAARQGVPNLTLSLVIEALAKTEPQPAVIEILPKLRRRSETMRAEQAANARALSEINRKIDGLNAVFSPEFRERLGAVDMLVGEALAAQIAPLEARLEESVNQRMEHVVRLTHKQSEETRDQVYEAVRILPNMIANMVGERVTQLDAPKEEDLSRRWFHFWRSEDARDDAQEPTLSRTWQRVKRTVSFGRLGNR
jgi:hypothetical protein